MSLTGTGSGLMRRGLWLAVAVLAIGADQAWAEHRVALVIGNGSYKISPLKNPRSDAGLMARTLAQTGFEVMTLMDATAGEMRSAIADFGARIKQPDSVALFYYAGHGVQVDGDNYLIPLAATFASTSDVMENAVLLQSVLQTMARSNSRLNIVLLDACRDNPFAKTGWETSVSGLASVVAPGGTIIGYATAPGQAAQDGAGANSPYTSALTSEIPRAGATIDDVFRATRRHVLALTGNTQTPWEHSSLVSAFSFVPGTAAANTQQTQASSLNAIELEEIEAWDLIKSTHDPALLKAHNQRYPDGLFAELGAVRIARLDAMRTQTPWVAMQTGGIDPDIRAAAAEEIYKKASALDSRALSAADLAAATRLFSEAAAEGHRGAQYRMGRAYDKGRGVPKDLLTAARWYEQAADQNEPAAMAALGTMHEFGEGAAPNLVEALRLYRKSADAGDAAGMTSLGYLYSQGKGVAQDTGEARRLYQNAAAQKYPRAMYNLALMMLNGESGGGDLKGAVTLLEGSAKLQFAPSLLQLARLYDKGAGVPRRPSEAARHILKAVKAAHNDGRTIDAFTGHWMFRTRREVQKQLAASGFYKGSWHGFLNDATRNALLASAEK